MEELRPKFVERGTVEQIWPGVEIPFYGSVSLGNGTRFTIGMMKVRTGGGERLFVGVERQGAYIFDKWVDAGYVAEKFKLEEYMSDARNLADFINRQTLAAFGRDYAVAYGRYDPELCVEGD